MTNVPVPSTSRLDHGRRSAGIVAGDVVGMPSTLEFDIDVNVKDGTS
jgi:hypothetical protein